MHRKYLHISILVIFTVSLLIIPIVADESNDEFQGLTWVTEEYPPYTFIDNGTPSGLMVDMVTAISRKAEYELPKQSIHFLPWNEAYQKALTKPGTVIFSIARTPERENLFSWVGPVVSSDIALYSSRDRNITLHDRKELANYTIGTITDDVTIDFLVDAGVRKDSIVTRSDPYELIHDLDDGTLDLFAYGNIAAEYHIKNATGNPGFYKISAKIGTFPVYIGFSAGTPENLVKKFQNAFETLNKTPDNGEISETERILSSWLLDENLKHLEYLTEGYYPYTFMEDGIPKGISIDILHEVFSRYGITIPSERFTFGTWEEVYQKTLTQNNTALCIIARSPEREDLFQWAGPIDKTSNVVFSRQDSADEFKNKTLEEMKIGAITDDIATIALINSGGKDIIYSTDPKELIKKLESGEIDGWAYASMPGYQLINKYASDPDSIVPVHSLQTYDYYIAFNKNTTPQVVQAFQDMLDIIRTEKDQTGVSTYDYIMYRYVDPVYSESSITPQDVTDLVNQTATDLARDAPGTIKNINAGLPPYRNAERPDLYVFMYDTAVNMVAHADNIRMVGANYHNKTDVAGKPFRDNIVQGALTNGSGWEDYIYSNPVESGLFWKTTRYQLAVGSDGKQYIICSGMFRNNSE
ncbi:transporter substrate-binding domain-containing protein [Methanospirillum sp.]